MSFKHWALGVIALTVSVFFWYAIFLVVIFVGILVFAIAVVAPNTPRSTGSAVATPHPEWRAPIQPPLPIQPPVPPVPETPTRTWS